MLLCLRECSLYNPIRTFCFFNGHLISSMTSFPSGTFRILSNLTEGVFTDDRQITVVHSLFSATERNKRFGSSRYKRQYAAVYSRGKRSLSRNGSNSSVCLARHWYYSHVCLCAIFV